MSNRSYFYVKPLMVLSDPDICCMSGPEFKEFWFNLCWAWKRGDGLAVQPYLDRDIISISQCSTGSSSMPRRPLSGRLRSKILERDGHKCVSCKSEKKLEIDHIIPYSIVHEHKYENLQVLCRSCNQIKGTRHE